MQSFLWKPVVFFLLLLLFGTRLVWFLSWVYWLWYKSFLICSLVSFFVYSINISNSSCHFTFPVCSYTVFEERISVFTQSYSFWTKWRANEFLPLIWLYVISFSFMILLVLRVWYLIIFGLAIFKGWWNKVNSEYIPLFYLVICHFVLLPVFIGP